MEFALPEFIKFYKRRPVKVNGGGMPIEQSYAFWYMLRQIRPTTVIESGAHKGHGTWLIRNALPTAKIISIDPAAPLKRLDGVEYLVRDKFVDFCQVNWTAYNLDVDETLVFIDDHMDAYRRMITENHGGFRHFIIEDNYPYLKDDAQSLKRVCERKRKSQWPGYV